MSRVSALCLHITTQSATTHLKNVILSMEDLSRDLKVHALGEIEYLVIEILRQSLHEKVSPSSSGQSTSAKGCSARYADSPAIRNIYVVSLRFIKRKNPHSPSQNPPATPTSKSSVRVWVMMEDFSLVPAIKL